MKCVPVIICAALLTLPVLWHVKDVHGADAPASMPPNVPYERELYTLSYDVFLANGNPADAFLLAQKAIQARPGDLTWRRKAAQSAEWSGNSAKALEQWYFIALEAGQKDARENAVRLARALGDGSRLKTMLEINGLTDDKAQLQEYIYVCEIAGKPEDAIAILEKLQGGKEKKYVHEQLARLYEAVGRNTEAIAELLNLSATHGINGKDLLKASSLAYGSGDVIAAYTILNLGKTAVSYSDQEYWNTFGDLAWALQDFPSAEKSSRIMIDSGTGRESDYQRLILLNREKEPAKAYLLALDAWKRFKKEGYLITLLELGTVQKRYGELISLINNAEQAGSLKVMEDGAYYWQLVSAVYQSAGDTGASLRSYKKAVAIAPGDHLVKSGYIWLLMDSGQRDELKRVLEGWKEILQLMPDMYDVYAVAYSYLGEYDKALIYYQVRYVAMRNDPSWLAGYADTLEQSGWAEPAFLERLRALHLVQKKMKSESEESESERQSLLNSYAGLAMRVEPGPELDRQIVGIMNKPQETVSRELVIAWAMSSGRADFGRIWYWKKFAGLVRRPLWVDLSLALEENDRPRILALLEKDLQRLPYRDAIEGATRTGALPLAEHIAFERLQTNDGDYLLDQQLRLLSGARPGGLRYGWSLINQDGVGFMEQRLSSIFAVTPRYSLKLEVGNTDIRHRRSGLLGEYTSSIRTAQMGLLMKHEHGTAEFTAGFTDALSSYVSASLHSDWRLNNRLTMDFALAMGTAGSESVYMKIGGIRDEARIGLTGSLTPRDSVSIHVSRQYLRDQERQDLGQGTSYEGEMVHRLLSGWPDMYLRAFGGYHGYESTGIPMGKTLALIPGKVPSASYFVPDSFSQAGFGISIGQDERTNYTRRWSPFASAETSWISTTGLGFHYELGLAGPVLGLDKLEIRFSQDSGSFGNSALTSRADLLYRYFFQ